MRKLLLKSQTGVFGMETVKGFFLAILILAVLGFAAIIAMGTLEDVNVLDTSSYEANESTNVLRNVTGGISEFFENSETMFTLLFVVVIMLMIGAVIYAVVRFGGGAAGGSL